MSTAIPLSMASGDILASSSDGGGSIGLLFFLSGFLFYGLMFLRYRNTDKHHRHAQETEAKLANVQAGDELRGKRTRLREKRIKGANERQVEGVQSSGAMAGLLGSGPGGSGGSVRKIFDTFR
ncbi:growth/differentiation factor [Bogoriella caseilytica]|uniref:Uncharacterized protein n=1 Tax=Bogoriella caseilytica TaxID=56055 RepID=A0A3N2BB17_9MICO|nr:growth/differentiation factor [Bogoriella caseilytica]ROR72372.1 hypothetical protein EDD31_0723 [Bogoriella caseilytica]